MHMHSDASKAASDVCIVKDVTLKTSMKGSLDVMKYQMLTCVTVLQVTCRSVVMHFLCAAQVCLLLSMHTQKVTFCVCVVHCVCIKLMHTMCMSFVRLLRGWL